MRDTVAELIKAAEELADAIDRESGDCFECHGFLYIEREARALRDALLTHERLQLAKEGS